MDPIVKKHIKLINEYASEFLLCDIQYYYLPPALHAYHLKRIDEVMAELENKSFKCDISSSQKSHLAILLFFFCEKTIEYFEIEDRRLLVGHYCDDDDEKLQEYYLKLTYISELPIPLMSYKHFKAEIKKAREYVEFFKKARMNYSSALTSGKRIKDIPLVPYKTKKMIIKTDRISFNIPAVLIQDFIEYTENRLTRFVKETEHLSENSKLSSKQPLDKIFANSVSVTILKYLRDTNKERTTKTRRLTFNETGIIGCLLIILGLIRSKDTFTPYDTGHVDTDDLYFKHVDITVRNYLKR